MIDFDRRSLLKTGAVAGLAVAMPAAIHATSPARPSLFVYDARFAVSAAEAELWRSRGVPVLDPRAEDLGIAWRRRIPDLLARDRPSIAGLTLWSDMFICATMGRDNGLRTHDDFAEGELRRWRLS